MEEKYPDGKLSPGDNGEVNMVVTEHEGRVILDFGKDVAWVGLTVEQAKAMASALNRFANKAEAANNPGGSNEVH